MGLSPLFGEENEWLNVIRRIGIVAALLVVAGMGWLVCTDRTAPASDEWEPSHQPVEKPPAAPVPASPAAQAARPGPASAAPISASMQTETAGETPGPAETNENPVINESPQPAVVEPVVLPSGAEDVVQVYAGQPLAMVHGAPVMLAHMMPLRKEDTHRRLTREQYEYRLQQAIEMELVFFEADTVEGAELTEKQWEFVQQVSGQHYTELQYYEHEGITWSSIGPEQLEFEQRLLAAKQLEQNLVAQRTGVAPSPDPEVQARYEEAREQMLSELQARYAVTRFAPPRSVP